jgi:hypothetical protein
MLTSDVTSAFEESFAVLIGSSFLFLSGPNRFSQEIDMKPPAFPFRFGTVTFCTTVIMVPLHSPYVFTYAWKVSESSHEG